MLIPLILLVIITDQRILLGSDYYGTIDGVKDKALAVLLYEAFAAGTEIVLGTCIFPGFFIENIKLHTGIQDHSIFIDG